ncbi:MAG: hypothetical protein ACO1SV_19895 [Fimbriimonas sp.]
MARRLTAKTLINQLRDVAQDSPAAVSVKVGGTSYALTGTFVGTVSGETYGAVVIGDHTLLLELDRRNVMRNAKVLTEFDVQAVAADLLPEPEPPQEIKDALDAVLAIKLPKGWKWGMDANGVPQPVVEAEGDAPPRRTRAPRGTAIKKEKKPEVVKGMMLTRSKDGFPYRVAGVDTNLKKVSFEPVTKGEGDEGLSATYPAPVFWKNWQLIADNG